MNEKLDKVNSLTERLLQYCPEYYSENGFCDRNFKRYTRNSFNDKLHALDTKPGNSVSKKTDYVLAAEKAGTNLVKAQALGI